MDHVYGKCHVARVIDGDTVALDVDLGFGVWVLGRSFRLLGCNAREHDAPGGPEATANLAALLPVGTQVSVTSVHDDKYGGRYDASITLPDGRDLTSVLVSEQWAAPWDGIGPKPVPPWPRTNGG
jgi:micrococcal nuclease